MKKLSFVCVSKLCLEFNKNFEYTKFYYSLRSGEAHVG